MEDVQQAGKQQTWTSQKHVSQLENGSEKLHWISVCRRAP